MDDRELKEVLKDQWDQICMRDEVKDKIRSRMKSGNMIKRRLYKISAAVAASVLIFTTTAFAGYCIYNKINVNDETLPEIAAMAVLKTPQISGTPDGDGYINKTYSSYSAVNDDLENMLLESPLASEHQEYERAIVDTDNENYMFIHVDNYIVGDVKNMEKLEDIERYSFESGEVYGSPIFLNVELILSDDQMEQGLDYDFLGYYEFREQYISKQGYKVNIVESSASKEGVPSEKNAVFVADGIRYRLQGCVSTETLKKIVDSMDRP